MKKSNEIEQVLRNDEAEEILLVLLELTRSGKIQWSCCQYDPIEPLSLYPIEEEDESLSFSHSFKVESVFRETTYRVEITEEISLPDEEGSIDVCLEKRTRQESKESGHSVSSASIVFSEKAKREFVSAVLPQIKAQTVIEMSFRQSAFDDMRGNTVLREYPITHSIEVLFRAHDAEGFHHLVCEHL